MKESTHIFSWQWLLLLVFAIVVFFLNLGSDGIYSAQEGRAAIVARNMLESGNYLHVVIKGEPETEKPIMCYWLYAISGNIFGVNEFSVRLPSALAAISTVLMAAWLGMRIYSAAAGLVAGYVLATMIGFVNLGRIARIDIVLCAFFTGAMLLLYTGYLEKRQANWRLYIFYLILALAVLIKGPVAAVMAGLIILAIAVRERNLRILWDIKPVSGLLIGLIIASPWYVYEIIRTNGNFAVDFFWNQNIDRFLGINTEYCGGVRKTFFYYFPKLFAGALPWSILLPFALWSYRRKFNKLSAQTEFLAFWVLSVFIFFSISAIKRGDYILPLYPALAILIGRYIAIVAENKPALSWNWKWFWGILTAIATTAWLLLATGVFNYFGQRCIEGAIPHLTDRDGMNIIQCADFLRLYLWPLVTIMALLLTLLYFIGKRLAEGKILPAFGAILAILIMLFSMFFVWLDPATNVYKTTKQFADAARCHLPTNAVVCYTGSWVDEAVFFINRDYERRGFDQFYDAQTKKISFEYIICPEYMLKNMPLEVSNQLELLESTIPGHQYPLSLFRIKK